MEKSGKCSVCGKEKRLIGRRMCCACYHRERRRGKLGARPQESFIVPVDFTPMAFLLEELQKRAGAELREIGPQILWELNKNMGAGLGT